MMMERERKNMYRLGWMILLLAGMVTSNACREPFEPEITSFESLLVVEGRMTTDTAGSKILLSRSYGFEGDTLIPVTGAAVTFVRDNGEVYQLSETEAGEYRSDPNAFMPQRGQAYKLSVLTSEGAEYASDFQTVKGTPVIESMDPIYSFTENANGSIVEGAQFQLNTSDPTGEAIYYAWDYHETWEFYVPFPKRAYWEWEPEPIVIILPWDEVVQRCWREEFSTQILVGTSQGLEEDKLVNYPIHFLDVKSEKVNWGYSLLVNQYAISEEEYTFLNTLKQNTETTGSIFDPIPAEISGNIRNLADPLEPVIGFFGASEVQSKRVIIDRSFFPDNVRPTQPLSACELDTIFFSEGPPEQVLADLRFETERLGKNYLDTAFMELTPVGFKIARDFCTDCKLTGSPIKPSYWPN